MKKDKSEDVAACDCKVIHEETVKKVRKKQESEKVIYELADFYKVFGDSTRLKILQALSVSPLCVCDMAFLLQMKQSAVSHQLRVLRQANLVKYKKEGKIVYYSLADSHVINIMQEGLNHINE